MRWNDILFTRSALYALFFSPYYFFHHQPSAKKKKNEKFVNFSWKLDKEDNRGVCYGEVVACASGVEERKKGVGMGREGKGLAFSFSYREIALTLPSPLLCLPLTKAKELEMSCHTIGTTFS